MSKQYSILPFPDRKILLSCNARIINTYTIAKFSSTKHICFSMQKRAAKSKKYDDDKNSEIKSCAGTKVFVVGMYLLHMPALSKLIQALTEYDLST